MNQADIKDMLVAFGLLVTFGLGLFNLWFNFHSSKRSSFVNTVTSERIKWIARVRERLSELLSACEQWMTHNTQARWPELQSRIDTLKAELRMSLNPDDPDDAEVERLILRLPNWHNSMSPEEFNDVRELLLIACKKMLKREWEKVKNESLQGRLR